LIFLNAAFAALRTMHKDVKITHYAPIPVRTAHSLGGLVQLAARHLALHLSRCATSVAAFTGFLLICTEIVTLSDLELACTAET
jgi:hypothetical protein